MRKLLIAFLFLAVMTPVLAATQPAKKTSSSKLAVQTTAPNKYEIGKYNFNINGEGVMVEATPATTEEQPQEQTAQPQKDVPAVKTETQPAVQTQTEPVQEEDTDSEEEFESLRNQTDIAPDYLQQNPKSQSRIINPASQTVKTEIKTISEPAKKEVTTTTQVIKQEVVNTTQNSKYNSKSTAKSKAKSKDKAKSEKKYDPDKPPVKFMIVPVQYKGESKRTIERINE